MASKCLARVYTQHLRDTLFHLLHARGDERIDWLTPAHYPSKDQVSDNYLTCGCQHRDRARRVTRRKESPRPYAEVVKLDIAIEQYVRLQRLGCQPWHKMHKLATPVHRVKPHVLSRSKWFRIEPVDGNGRSCGLPKIVSTTEVVQMPMSEQDERDIFGCNAIVGKFLQYLARAARHPRINQYSAIPSKHEHIHEAEADWSKQCLQFYQLILQYRFLLLLCAALAK